MLDLKSLLGRYSDSRISAPRGKAPAADYGKLPDRDICREELMLVYEPLILSCFDHAGGAGACRRS